MNREDFDHKGASASPEMSDMPADTTVPVAAARTAPSPSFGHGAAETAANQNGEAKPSESQDRRTPNLNMPLIVIGGSAGALQEVQTMLAGIPTDFSGAVCVVLHTSPQSQLLADNLKRSSAIPVCYAFDGQRLERGHVYVAPSDYHMLIKDDRLRVIRGPRENHCRPAIDPLFRSAALAFGDRVRAIVLSGYLDDGASGSIAISRCGGRVAVQSPASASVADMPNNTLSAVDVDFVGTPVQLTRWLVGSFDESAGRSEFASSPLHDRQIEREVHISESIESNIPLEEELGELVAMTCPECSGPLWELKVDKVRRYRCHTGHAYTAKSLVAHQDETIETALWAAMRLMQERANSLEQLAKDNVVGSETFSQRAAESRTNAQVLRRLLVGSCKAESPRESSLPQTQQEHV